MISRKYKRLIRKHFKEDLSPKERAYLENGVKEVAEVKSYMESMSRLDELLAGTIGEEPEADIKDSVMRSIRHLRAEDKSETTMKNTSTTMDPWRKAMSRLFPNPSWNIAFAFIAGVLITSLLFTLFYERGPSGGFTEQDLTGTMSSRSSEVSLTIPVDLPDVKINLQAYSMPQDFTQVTVDVDSEKICLINISYNNSAFQVWSLRAMQNRPDCEIMAAYKAIRIGNSGKNAYTLLMKKLTYVREELILEVYVEGNLEYSTHFEI